MKPKQQQKAPIPQQPNTVVFSKCSLFEETFARHKHNAQMVKAFTEFVLLKTEHPIQAFGSKDRPFTGHGNFAGLFHAGLTFDISVIYKLSGRNPTTVFLYAIVTHDESGTGTPPNIKRQKQLRSRIDSQEF